MAKTPASAAAPATVKVRLSCFYSGHPDNPGPGAIIDIDAAEADRLVALGAGEKIGGK
jgi:hypothetical protein